MKKIANKLYVPIGVFIMLVVCAGGIASAQSGKHKLYVENQAMGQREKTNMVPLSKVLEKIERTRHITFLYQPGLIEGKTAPQMILQSGQLVRKIGKLLAQNGLIYFKQKEATYIIKHLVGFPDPVSPLEASTVTGTVTDAGTQETLPGVNILVKGTTTGASTDKNGHYELTVESLQDTLVVSYIGYKTQSVPINGRTRIDIALQSQAILGKEMVVVGYGAQKKSDLTGAISSVSEEDIENSSAANISEVLTGKVSGVYVSPNSGQPGQTSMVRIRGFGTVNNNNPLYVVDGQPIDNINNLNPSDISNIEILKDASATAIYGSRGSNGVILITTKEGNKEKTTASFDSYIGFKDSPRSINMQNSDQYYNFITNAYENSGQTLNPKFKKQYLKGYDTDWWQAVNKTGLTQNYNFSIRSGGENSQSYLSLGYKDDDGAIITTKYKRITLKLNSEYDISPKFKVGVHLGAAKSDYVDTGSLPRFDFILDPDPFTPVINPGVDKSDPNYKYNKYGPPEWAFNPNPVSILRINDRNSNDLNLYGNVYGRYNLTEGLDYYVQYNFENNNNRFTLFQPRYHSQFDSLNLANETDKYRDETYYTDNNNIVRNYNVQQRLHYNHSFGKHSVDATAAMTYNSENSENVNGFKKNAPGNGQSFRVLDAATSGAQASGGRVETSILSYLGRLNYSYNSRYLATVNFRADGSSRFAEGHKWGYFPSFSLGWRMSDEGFFKSLGLSSIITNLKVRGGWGETGNQRIARNAAITLLGTDIQHQWYFGSGFSQGYVPTNIGNQNIKWETGEQTNIGLDARLFNDELSFSVDYYIKKTKDMLLQVPLPAISGYPNNPFSNAGNIENRGFSLSADYNYSNNIFSYSIGANVSRYINKVTSLGNGGIPLFGAASKTVVGGPISRFFGYKYLNIFQNQEEINNYVGPDGQVIQPNAKPGDFKFADLNSDGTLNDEDRTYIGNPHPDLIYGFHLGANYKGFDFSAFFQGKLGNEIYNNTKTLSVPGFQNALAKAYTDAWVKEGDTDASFPRITLTDDNNNLRNSSWWVADGSFLRLQNLQIGYNLPESLIQEFKLLSSCRIYLSGNNVFTLTKYPGLDPDIGSTDALNLGYDPIRYPSSRIFSIGINAKF